VGGGCIPRDICSRPSLARELCLRFRVYVLADLDWLDVTGKTLLANAHIGHCMSPLADW